MSTEQPCYTLIAPSKGEPLTEQQLKNDIEKGNDEQKIKSLKEVIKGLLQGIKYPGVLMHVIRFILPRRDHMLKKLLLIYFEIVPKRSSDGKLLPQMILVCDAYRRDLEHPNEYVRGATLRFLSKLKEAELLEPLMPTICANLEHKHSYVRRNAVLCIYTIFKQFQFLMPDAPDIISSYLDGEKDMSCKRNAFMMLTYADQEKALDYVSSRLDEVANFGDILQLMFVELVYKVCRSNPAERGHFIRSIYQLLSAPSAAVRFESAKTLLALTSAPTAVSAVVKCFLDLVYKESDNNIKLVVLDNVEAVRNNPTNAKIVQASVMDLLRCLNAPDVEVRRKVLDITISSITSKNVSDVVTVLRKELAKTLDEIEFNDKYRQILVKALHTCAVKFPIVAVQIVPLLMDFLGETHTSADDVISSVREAMEYFPELRPSIIEKLLETFGYIKAPNVFRTCLWILGEYCNTVEEIDSTFVALHGSIGELPIVENEMKAAGAGEEGEENDKEKVQAKQSTSSYTKVNSDGSYATQSAFTVNKPDTSSSSAISSDSTTPLRDLLLQGKYFVASVLSACLVKLSLRREELSPHDPENNKRSAEAMLIMASILHLGKSGISTTAIDDDTYDRVMLCLRVLAEPSELTTFVFLQECRTSLASLLDEMQREVKDQEEKLKGDTTIHVDDALIFRQLGKVDEQDDEIETSLSIATGSKAKPEISSNLNKVFQLTGFSDPVYAEAYVNVNQYDITLDVLVVNQTEDTLQNLGLELSTMGDLKLVERPQTYTLAPQSFITIKSNVKVSSSETGVIFGNIVYDVSGTTETSCVVLNDIHIDIIDYILPASCSDQEFRTMWIEFEWENKVVVNTDITSLEEYTQHIVALTNMKCLTLASRGDECDFYAAKLYARSMFGEDALASLSIEKDSRGKVVGHIRIRAKTQGIALSLGDKITLNQRKG